MRVLTIDDDRRILELYGLLLGLAGCEVFGFGDPRQAIAWAGSHQADGVICDLRMAPLDGYDVVRSLRRLPGYEAAPIAVCTASDESEEALRRAGFSAVVYKPFELHQLLGAMGLAHVFGADARPEPAFGG